MGLFPFLISCNLLTPLAFVVEHKKKVSAEFDKLPGKRVAVLVWTDPSTQFDYPYARFELATYIGDKLYQETATRQMGVDVVDPRDVEDFLEKNVEAQVDPIAVGTEFDADYVIQVELFRFQIRDPDQPQFLQGIADASVSVHDIRADPDLLRRYELTPVECFYPETSPIIMNPTNAPLVREATYRKFAEQVARKFYEYTVDM
jgi:hypothetical protein